MKKDPDLKCEVGDRVKFVLRSGKIEEGVVRAVIHGWGRVEYRIWYRTECLGECEAGRKQRLLNLRGAAIHQQAAALLSPEL